MSLISVTSKGKENTLQIFSKSENVILCFNFCINDVFLNKEVLVFVSAV